MNVVDSSGWIEYLTDGPAAADFAPPLEALDQLVVPTICILEVAKWVRRSAGPREAARVVALMKQGQVAGLDPETAVLAAELGLQHALALADSVILATAQMHGAMLWTQDAHFQSLAGVRFFAKR